MDKKIECKCRYFDSVGITTATEVWCRIYGLINPDTCKILR